MEVETQMKSSSRFVHYDSHSDTVYIVAGRGMEEEFVEVAPGLNVELDAKGDGIGIEILKASKFFLSADCQAVLSADAIRLFDHRNPIVVVLK